VRNLGKRGRAITEAGILRGFLRKVPTIKDTMKKQRKASRGKAGCNEQTIRQTPVNKRCGQRRASGKGTGQTREPVDGNPVVRGHRGFKLRVFTKGRGKKERSDARVQKRSRRAGAVTGKKEPAPGAPEKRTDQERGPHNHQTPFRTMVKNGGTGRCRKSPLKGGGGKGSSAEELSGQQSKPGEKRGTTQ